MTQNLGANYSAHIDTLKARHDAALAASGFDHVAFFGGALHTIFLDDMDYPFKANPHLKYWVPVVSNPNCFLVYTPGNKPLLVFYKPVDYWYKVADAPSGYWVDHFDIRFIANAEDAKALMPKGRAAFIGEWSPAFEAWGFAANNPSELVSRLHFDRATKTAYEIDCTRAATTIGVRAHRAAEKAFRAGASEFEINLEYLRSTGHMEH